MTKRFAVLSALLLATTLAAPPTTAEEAKPADPSQKENVARDAAPSKTPLPVEQLHLSEQLAAYGRANKDPLSLIVAAQIRSQVGVKVVDRKPDNADAVGTASADAGATVDGLLNEAKSLAKNDKTIVALADDVKASATKGRVGGGIVSLGQISGRTIHNRTMNFRGGQVAEVAAVGIDSDSVMLEVFDEGGHLICRDHDPAYCRFNPIWTGPFTVKVHNNGSSLAHYRLETN
ncbi:hypothetical protein [Pinisolibacter aquiterrae]|uniref:hypothetical protein n=1 Tax=Pinisolibacter aquiterrae TaxID=2815579 RepID=UPI001C3D1DF0|nr:hypothetical protein [Pinisolibacter aquiterrae]MBV5262800.1 hypothetical protein [Pinisolibacter aquiterrae]MCC8233298.1 hypothetical protein [Pinisolibacter aquiterrae]